MTVDRLPKRLTPLAFPADFVLKVDRDGRAAIQAVLSGTTSERARLAKGQCS